MINYIPPVKGAAEYFCGYDYENKKKPCVWMKDTEGHVTIIDYAKTIEKAREKALNWQKKENAIVLKNQPSSPC